MSEHRSEDVTGPQDARLNAERLSLAARWRHALEAEHASDDEFWEAREMSEIGAQAARDKVLLAMLRDDEADAIPDELGSSVAQDAELARAKAHFESRMREAEPPIFVPQVLVTEAVASALTVGEVVEAMEREAQIAEAQRAEPERQSVASWRALLEPVRASNEPLPTHITAKAMREFWTRKGLSLPREVSAAFSQVARLLLMSRATPSTRLSMARSARPSGISDAVERLASQASPESQSTTNPAIDIDQIEAEPERRDEPAST